MKNNLHQICRTAHPTRPPRPLPMSCEVAVMTGWLVTACLLACLPAFHYAYALALGTSGLHPAHSLFLCNDDSTVGIIPRPFDLVRKHPTTWWYSPFGLSWWWHNVYLHIKASWYREVALMVILYQSLYTLHRYIPKKRERKLKPFQESILFAREK